MKTRVRPYRKESAVEFLLLRERLGLRRYRKTVPRDPEEGKILLELALNKMNKAEQDNYSVVGDRRRRFKI